MYDLPALGMLPPVPRRRTVHLFVLAVASGFAPTARAQSRTATAATQLNSPTEAVAVARAAFEYRDFRQVVAALDAWVHPPRIRDPSLMVEARRLLGVSLHVQGDVRGAREEFAQLLLLDPSHRLDPFFIPPRVIATFEEVRKQLEPSLGLPARPGDRTVFVERPHPAVVLLPLGLPQFALEEPVPGFIYGALQLLGLGLNVAAFFRGQALGEQSSGSSELDTWLAVQYGGAALLGLSYGASVIHGQVLLDRRGAETVQRTSQLGSPFVPRINLRF